jgi:hypothetical protein
LQSVFNVGFRSSYFWSSGQTNVATGCYYRSAIFALESGKAKSNAPILGTKKSVVTVGSSVLTIVGIHGMGMFDVKSSLWRQSIEITKEEHSLYQSIGRGCLYLDKEVQHSNGDYKGRIIERAELRVIRLLIRRLKAKEGS